MRKFFWFAGFFGLLATSPVYAMSAQDACEDDAMRLCSSEIPDASAIERCLRSKVGSLSPACRAQFGGGKSAKSTKSAKRRH